MLKNYVVITFRNFFRNRNYALINILGLSIGITSCVIIFILITYDLSFDSFHTNYEKIFRIVQDAESSTGTVHSSATPYPFAKAFRNDFDIPLVTQMHNQFEALLKIGSEKQKVKNILFADSLFFEVFNFKILSGNPKVDLGQPGKVFLTKSLADRILKGKEKASITINKVDLEVVGIIEDPPANSHINFCMVISMPSLTGDFVGGLPLDQWGMTARSFTYIVLPSEISAQSINNQLKSFVNKYHSRDDAARTRYTLQPLKDIHFNKEYSKNPGAVLSVEKSDLFALGILGIFILCIACINFVNMATALAVRKSKEVGVRKTLGATRKQLTVYFLGETFLLILVSVLVSLGTAEWLLSWFNQFLDKDLELDLLSNPGLLAFLFAVVIFSTLLSGFYPAVVLSGFSPMAVLKNRFTVQPRSGVSLRRVLVVLQLFIAQGLIICTLIVADQIAYFNNKPLGFNKEAVVSIPIPINKKEVLESLRTGLESSSGIKSLSFATGAPISGNDFYTDFFLRDGGKEEGPYSVGFKSVDRYYLDTYDIKLIGGRWFNETDENRAATNIPPKEQKYVYVINEAAMKRLGFSDPEKVIGKSISSGVGGITAEVVGVVGDFHISSLHKEIMPVIFMTAPYFYFEAGVKLDVKHFAENVEFIKSKWLLAFPDNYFEYEFLDEHLAALYQQENNMFVLFKIFAGVSIVIGCLGLYGLIAFMANQKVKEVGIRKVMGASVANIVSLFSGEFVRLIVIAFVVAAPLSWYLMNLWLQSFAYHVAIQWSVFVVGIMLTFFIAMLTVGYTSIKAAASNPVESLKEE
jgi:putative ABC transport system permease protein